MGTASATSTSELRFCADTFADSSDSSLLPGFGPTKYPHTGVVGYFAACSMIFKYAFFDSLYTVMASRLNLVPLQLQSSSFLPASGPCPTVCSSVYASVKEKLHD